MGHAVKISAVEVARKHLLLLSAAVELIGVEGQESLASNELKELKTPNHPI